MCPILIKFGFINVYSYGLFLALGFTAALFLACRQADKYGFKKDYLSDLSFVLLISGVIGARLLYVILHHAEFRDNFIDVFLLNKGGLSWFGGLLSAVFSGIYFILRSRQNVLLTADFLSPYLALAQSIGRIGCLLNGCCAGYPSKHGLYFPVYGQTLIPTQIYSSLALLVIFFILRSWQGRKHNAGDIFLGYLMLYSGKRFLIEFLRGEERLFFLGLSVFQWISVLVFICALSVLLFLGSRRRGAVKK